MYALRAAAAVDIYLLVRSFSSYRKRALGSRRQAFYSTKLYGVYSGGRSIIVSLVLEFKYGLAPSYFELIRYLDILRGQGSPRDPQYSSKGAWFLQGGPLEESSVPQVRKYIKIVYLSITKNRIIVPQVQDQERNIGQPIAIDFNIKDNKVSNRVTSDSIIAFQENQLGQGAWFYPQKLFSLYSNTRINKGKAVYSGIRESRDLKRNSIIY